MIGRYWSTGIRLRFSGGAGGWSGSVDFWDQGYGERDLDEGDIAIGGRLRSRGSVDDLDALTNTLKRDAEHLGIEFKVPALYYQGAGNDAEPPISADQLHEIRGEAHRIGWDADIELGERGEEGFE